MKVFFNAADRLDLREFGIDIPAGRDNALRTLELLKQRWEAKGGAMPPEWLSGNTAEPPSMDDILRVHDPVYVQSLFRGGESLEGEIMRAFELVRPDGSYHRYHPGPESRPLTELFSILLSRGGGTKAAGQWALGIHPDQKEDRKSNQDHFGPETAEGEPLPTETSAEIRGGQTPPNEAFYCGGGFHHAMYSFGEGFCLYNDVLTAIRSFQDQGIIRNAWIIDVDAHKGDGTAALTQDDPTLATLSVHMAHGWPLDITAQEAATRPDRSPLSFLPSTVDIGITQNEDCDYCIRLAQGLDLLWNSRGGTVTDDAGRARPVPHPDLVYVLLGADPFEEDELPSAKLLALSRDQMCNRDRLIREFFVKRGVPAAYLMAGNYGESSWKVYSDFLSWSLGMEDESGTT
ncbi:arginase family protein [Spirochaeta lutea]|uniref:hypothetical protein n=1 Tax=Spirochaeta lutea TaxID=1480694 RepID=UPI00068BFAC1|nr:hypothetical protein [Spirochaeta lutea]